MAALLPANLLSHPQASLQVGLVQVHGILHMWVACDTLPSHFAQRQHNDATSSEAYMRHASMAQPNTATVTDVACKRPNASI